jgi:hypothetical protein
VVEPIIVDLKADIAAAIVKVKALAGLDADVILGVGVDVNVIAQIVADLVIVSLFALLLC